MDAGLSEREAEVVEAIVAAYREGWFPMANARGRVRWYRPARRGVIPLDGFRAPRSLRARVRSGRFAVTADRAFGRVIRACAGKRARGEATWINEEIVTWYELLHRAGVAHSVEAWVGEGPQAVTGERAAGGTSGPRLVGGLYGVAIGGLFAGESMFCRPEEGGTDASKVCLVRLVEHLRSRGYALLDTQIWNEHTAQFGCVEVPRGEYLRRLGAAVGMGVTWGRWGE